MTSEEREIVPDPWAGAAACRLPRMMRAQVLPAIGIEESIFRQYDETVDLQRSVHEDLQGQLVADAFW